MEGNKLDKIYQAAVKTENRFRHISDYLVERYVTAPVGGTLNQAQRDVISKCWAEDMAIGARVVRTKYIMTGVVVGSLVAVVAMHLYKKNPNKAGS